MPLEPAPNPDGSPAPQGADIDTPLPARRWTARRIAFQIVGLVIGLGLLAWAASLALSESNRACFTAMREAPPWKSALLVGLSATGLLLNGLMFWAVLRPLRRLDALDVIAVNAIATFLSVLPFKIGLATRLTIHHRRDKVRWRDLLAWLAAMGALALAVLVPLAAAGLWRRQLDALWWLTAVGGIGLANLIGVWCGRSADRWPVLARLSLGADRIVRHPSAVVAHVALRSADIIALTGRFLVASWIIGLALPVDQAVLIATTYFLLSVSTPTGTLGFREAGVAALGLARGLDHDALALLALVVTGAELLAAAIIGVLGAARIRPGAVLRGNGAGQASS